MVEKVESGRGEEGDCIVKERVGGAVVVVDMFNVDDGEGIGLRAGSLSETGTGRRRLRIDEAAGMGSWSMVGVVFGRGGGGEAGGECWYVVLVL